MSSIFGIWNFDGRPVAESQLARMSDALTHRGIDDGGLWIGGEIGLGHGLRRITREDAFECQPLCDAQNRFVLIADLRLDNREELATALAIPPAQLARMADSALLLAAYARWEIDCASRLVGDFVFAVWHRQERKLILGRDHLGMRSLVFHKGDGKFAFASEPRALWMHPDVPRRLDEAGIARMLLHDMSPRPNGSDLFEGIESIAGGTIAIIDDQGRIARKCYWQPHPAEMHLNRDEGYYVEAYRRVLGEAVACRLRRNLAPTGLLLSGGFDSTAIAALSGPVVQAQGRKLVCASSVMPADGRGTIRNARRWVEACQRHMPFLDVHYVTREGLNLVQAIENSLVRGDARMGVYGLIRDRLCAVVAQHGVHTVMDGLGGDLGLNWRGVEVLPRFLIAGQVWRFLRELHHRRRVARRSIYRVLKNDVVAVLMPAAAMRLWRYIRNGFKPAWMREAVAPDFARAALSNGIVAKENLRCEQKRKLDVQGHMILGLQRHMWRDSDPMLSGLQRLQPFYDKRVVELGLAIPPEFQVRNGRNRYLACRALDGLYPPELKDRSWANDDQIPDFWELVKSAEPQLSQELDALASLETVRHYFDIQKIRSLLMAGLSGDHKSGGETELHLAIEAYSTARFIRRFSGSNF